MNKNSLKQIDYERVIVGYSSMAKKKDEMISNSQTLPCSPNCWCKQAKYEN